MMKQAQKKTGWRHASLFNFPFFGGGGGKDSTLYIYIVQERYF